MGIETTLFVIKPDAIKRGLVGSILSRLEELRLDIVGVKVMRVSKELAEQHYIHIREKPFFTETVDYLQGKLHDVPYVVVFAFQGVDAIERVRKLTGATHPEKADPVSIRGSVGRMATTGWMENVVHASADSADAARELRLWFHPHELLRLELPVLQRVRPTLS